MRSDDCEKDAEEKFLVDILRKIAKFLVDILRKIAKFLIDILRKIAKILVDILFCSNCMLPFTSLMNQHFPSFPLRELLKGSKQHNLTTHRPLAHGEREN